MEKKRNHQIKERDINLQEKGRILIKSKIEEEMSVEEFRTLYQESLNKSDNLKYQIEVFGKEIKLLENSKETKKDRELAEHLEKAKQIIQRKLLQEKLEDMRKNLEILKKDILRFSPYMAELNQKDKREVSYLG